MPEILIWKWLHNFLLWLSPMPHRKMLHPPRPGSAPGSLTVNFSITEKKREEIFQKNLVRIRNLVRQDIGVSVNEMTQSITTLGNAGKININGDP